MRSNGLIPSGFVCEKKFLVAMSALWARATVASVAFGDSGLQPADCLCALTRSSTACSSGPSVDDGGAGAGDGGAGDGGAGDGGAGEGGAGEGAGVPVSDDGRCSSRL